MEEKTLDIGENDAGDKEDAKKMPEKTLVKLEGMGFTEKEDKPGLFSKNIDDVNFFWDFRKTKNGSAYASRTKEDGEGFDNIPRQELEQMEEYLTLRPEKNGKTEKKDVSKIKNITPDRILRDKTEAHDIMNIKDDQQVLAEIQGQFLEEFVYNFKTKGGEVTGLSWAGTKEIARRQGNISIEDIKITETDNTYRVLAKAKDITRNVTMFGIAEQSKKMKLKSGHEIEDLHSLSKCVSRSQRNAIRALIPEIFIKEMIKQFLKEKNRKSN